jgi:hypothetical protein
VQQPKISKNSAQLAQKYRKKQEGLQDPNADPSLPTVAKVHKVVGSQQWI